MGRMLETLKLGEPRRVQPTTEKPTADTAVQDCVVDWEIGEEVPFVEVGGPNKKVELSPGLSAHPAQSVPQPPHHAVEIAPVVVKVTPARSVSVKLTPTPAMTVAYEAYPSVAPIALKIASDVIAYHHPEHAISKEYAGLLDAMLTKTKGNVLLFVSMKPQVGASTLILNLAAIAANQKKLRVALIEANGVNAGLAQRLGHTGKGGLDDVIAGTLGMEQAIVKTPLPTLDLLPQGDKTLAIGTEAMTWLCAWLRQRYDLVLIDGPTLEESAALAAQIPQAHGVYLVLPHGETAAGKGQTIHRLGGRLCGMIHTNFEM